MTVRFIVNIDVPDLAKAEAFYTAAFGLKAARRFGETVELVGGGVAIYLLKEDEGTPGAGSSKRTYQRHWTPAHVDFIVDDIEAAITRAVSAGAKQETQVRREKWGKIAGFADPFGHGFDIIEFTGRGYDEIT